MLGYICWPGNPWLCPGVCPWGLPREADVSWPNLSRLGYEPADVTGEFPNADGS